MSTVVKKTINLKIDGKDVTAPEGTVILEAAKKNGFEVSNLCYNKKLKPFAACRTCMVETVTDGEKELVYSCTHPVAEGMEVKTNTDETNRYNKACLEMLLVEHPLDCPICDKSGVCPLQDNTDTLKLYNGRFEINRRNEPSIKSNPIIELYMNRCIMCGLCVRACDETQGVQALDFHKRGMKVGIGTANDEPLDCEFCGQCITVCPTGALMDMTSEARGLAAMYTNTHTTCNYCSWGCTLKLQTKKGKVLRIEADEDYDVGINEGNLCAKGRFGHGIIHNDNRIKSPLMNYGGEFKEISWDEAIQTIAERLQSTVNRSGPESIAGIGSEKLTNEENYLFQKLFRNQFGSNQVTNLAHLRAPYINQFMLDCFKGGIESKPITELEHADVVLIFNSDLPSEYPVGGNSIRKGAVFTNTDIIIANPRDVVFNNEAQCDLRLTFTHGADLAVVNRLIRIILDEKLIDLAKAKAAVPNFDALVKSLAPYSAEGSAKMTGISDAILIQAAKQFAKKADRFVLIGNDILDTGQGQDILNALLNLSLLVQHGGEGSISIYPPREHCNSQGVNDMGVTPEFLPGYQSAEDPAALETLSKEWERETLKPAKENLARELFENCANGSLKLLYIAGEDPIHSYYKSALVKKALQTVPFLVVQDVFMTETAKMADIILPTVSFAEKDGTFTNMTRHVQRVKAATLPQGMSKPDLDIFCDIADAVGKPFKHNTVEEVQEEIERAVPFYKGTLPGDDSKQWSASGFATKPEFQIGQAYKDTTSADGYPYRLQTNNHMFHIGSYSQHAKALVEVGPKCFAEVHPEDAEALSLQDGDRIVVESKNAKVEVPVKLSYVTTRGMVYIPKNWVDVPVHLLRNGEEGLVSIKISKAD
ncbi:MAG: molybdopterin-dependent oxidoreductase [Nitrospinae bacterium]|jgi:formate dehydrogenase (NADP+) alpha subunit|nr:molybdopterin-dependent oxidoreductase [Nitrospinota bacterium]MDA1110706.1 molybdopterin-dependent oxidoreductase [Nitrospinota bacterium]